MAPYTVGRIGTLLNASALGAASSCTEDPYGNICGLRWYINGFDNKTGLGQQLSAMEVTYALLVNETSPPGTGAGAVVRGAPDNLTGIASSTPSQPPPGATTRTVFDGRQGAGSLTHIASFPMMVVASVMLTMFS